VTDVRVEHRKSRESHLRTPWHQVDIRHQRLLPPCTDAINPFNPQSIIERCWYTAGPCYMIQATCGQEKSSGWLYQSCNTRAVQPVATCRQSPYLHKPAIVIVTSFSLWSPYVIGQTIFILSFVMAALCNRAGHSIFALWFLSIFYLSFFIPRLISAVADWMSAIL